MSETDNTRKLIDDLAAVQPGYDKQHSAENLAPEYADRTYNTLFNAGLIGGPFQPPSVRLTHEQRFAANKLTVVSASESEKPEEALVGITKYPAVVREEHSVADEFPEGCEYSVKWFGFDSIDAAQDYVTTNGSSIEIPGPGEFLGEFWTRIPYHNPYFIDNK